MSQISAHPTIDELSLAITYPKNPTERRRAVDALHARAMIEYGAHLHRESPKPISRAALDLLKGAELHRQLFSIAHSIDTTGDVDLLAVGELVARELIVWRDGRVYLLTFAAVSLRGRLL